MLASVVAAVAAGVVVGSSGAASKATVTCGDTISSPGIYSLAGDCTGGGITIDSDYVTLQLLGHKMTANFCCPPGVDVFSASHVLVKGPGAILGYYFGVLAEGSSDVRVDGLTIVESVNGIQVNDSTNVALTHNSIGPTDLGVALFDSRGSTVEWNKVADSYDGIDLAGDSYNNTVVDNTATSNVFGIYLEQGSTGNRIFANNAKGNQVYDLYDGNGGCDNNQWRRNGFNTANQSCIH
jgi:parallel beta-helix repeat protein